MLRSHFSASGVAELCQSVAILAQTSCEHYCQFPMSSSVPTDAKVWVDSCTGKGLVLGHVVQPVYEGFTTVEYELNGISFRKHVVPQSQQVQRFIEDSSANKLYHQFLRVSATENVSSYTYEELREARMRSVISNMCATAKLSLSRDGKARTAVAIFITGCIGAGKSTFINKLDRQSPLVNFVHVNADSIRSQLVGGDQNSQMLLLHKDKPMHYKEDVNAIRLKVTDAVIQGRRNYISDSRTVPTEAITQFLHVGYQVIVVFLEIGLEGTRLAEMPDSWENKEEIARSRMHQRRQQGGSVSRIKPGWMQDDWDHMVKVAHSLQEHGIPTPVHFVTSERDEFIYRGDLMMTSMKHEDQDAVMTIGQQLP